MAVLRLPKPRFSLAALMLVVTAAAIAMWVYVVAIPAWRDHERRQEFEISVRQLKAGPGQDLFKVLPTDGTLNYTKYSDAQRRYVSNVPFFFERYWYCVYFVLAPSVGNRAEETWEEVRVYRLSPAPRNYQAQTKQGRQSVMQTSTHKEIPRDVKSQYLTDFLEIATGRETSDLGIDYELIYADTTTIAKPSGAH